MNDTEITIILPTSAAKEIFFDGWLHGFEPSTWLKKRILSKLSTPVMEETPEHRAALPHVAAPAPAAAPVRKTAPTTGLLELFGGEEDDDPATADADPIIHP